MEIGKRYLFKPAFIIVNEVSASPCSKKLYRDELTAQREVSRLNNQINFTDSSRHYVVVQIGGGVKFE